MPTLHTVPVTCRAFDQNGNPVVEGRFVATLSVPEIYQGFVVPEQAEAFTDTNGICVLNLWPNALGVAGSGYNIKAWNPDTGKLFLDGLAVVPNQACNLESILSLEPYPEIDASQQAMIASQAALAEVTALVDDAAASQVAAAASEAAAEADRVASLASQVAAANSAAEAAYSAGRIDLGELDTAVAATIANAQLTADDVVTSTTLAGIATTMRDQAVAAEAGADAARDEAVLKEAAASASATAASISQVAAAASEAAAAASETAAGLSELASEAAEIAAETAQASAEAASVASQASADAAGVQAGLAADEATASAASAAAALASETAADASADAALASAGVAAGHADAAGVSAGNALAQATAAEASAVAADASADAAAATVVATTAQADAAAASATVAEGHATAADTARVAAELAETNAEAAAATATTQATAAGTARDEAEAAQAAAEASAATAYAAATGGAGGVLSGSFPNPGFAVDMATQAELDTKASLAGATFTGHVAVPTGATAAQAPRANEVYKFSFPPGTKMLFIQTAAPTGWTKDVVHDNKALRVVSGAAGSGGTVNFTTAFASKAVAGTVGSTVLTTAQMPSHAHVRSTIWSEGGVNMDGNMSAKISGVNQVAGTAFTGFEGGGGAHNHSFAGTAIDLAVQYVDTIIATKD